MLNTSNNARVKFRNIIETGIKRFSGDIRWYYLQDCASQIVKYWPQVLSLINDEDDFTPAIRIKLKSLLEEHMCTIRLELALFEDVAIPLSKLCYKQEGDSFLIPTTYDHWFSILSLLQAFFDGTKPLETVSKIALELYPNDHLERNEAIVNTRLKMYDCIQKMNDTSSSQDKHHFTLKIFRACRLLDFKFVAVTPLLSLAQHTHGQHVRGEIIELFNLPFIHTGQIGDVTCLLPFVQEMTTYQQISRQFIADNSEQEDSVSDTYL
jgi:hypothetical protein